jgi:hypothetical protein
MGESIGDDPFPAEENKTKDSRPRQAPIVTSIWLCVGVLADGSWREGKDGVGVQLFTVSARRYATGNKETTVHGKM